MTETQTLDNKPVTAGVDANRVPASVRAEFSTMGPLDKDSKASLDALEAQINAQINGTTPHGIIEIPNPMVNPDPMTPPPTTVAPVVQPTQPQQTVNVPEKFRNADGTLNEARLDKSLSELQRVKLETFLQLEKEQTQRRMQSSQPQAFNPPILPQTQTPNMESFEQRINADIQKDPGRTVANLFQAAIQTAGEATAAQTRELNRKLELMEIAKDDPGVFTQEGLQELSKILEARPYLWNSPTPWTDAYEMSGRRHGRQVTAPAPAPQGPQRISAPILPGGSAPPPVNVQVPRLSSEADLRQLLLNSFPNDPQKQADFLEKIIFRNAK